MIDLYFLFSIVSIIVWNCLTLKFRIHNWIVIDWKLMKPTLLFEIVWLWNFQIDIWLIIDWKIVRPKFLFEMCLWQDSIFQKLVLDWLKKIRFTIIDWYLFGNSFKIENCLKLFEYCYKPIEIVWNYIYYPFLKLCIIYRSRSRQSRWNT